MTPIEREEKARLLRDRILAGAPVEPADAQWLANELMASLVKLRILKEHVPAARRRRVAESTAAGLAAMGLELG